MPTTVQTTAPPRRVGGANPGSRDASHLEDDQDRAPRCLAPNGQAFQETDVPTFDHQGDDRRHRVQDEDHNAEHLGAHRLTVGSQGRCVETDEYALSRARAQGSSADRNTVRTTRCPPVTSADR